MPARRALVVGVGIAGLATALRLSRSDWQIVLLERDCPTPGNRFPSALRGVGYDAAARLGLLRGLDAVSQPRCGMTLIDATGTPLAVRPKPSVPVLCSDDVASVLWDALGELESRRRTDVVSLVQDDCGATVWFSDGSEDWFDLVVDTDGPESSPRSAIQGSALVSCLLQSGAGNEVSMELQGRSVHLRPLRDGSSAVLFIWQGDVSLALPEVFGDLRWPSELLSLLDSTSVFRRACAGTHVDRWAHHQIALLGDAAWCANQLWDKDVSLSIGAAELLGDALDIFTETAEALVWWEDQMRRLVRRQGSMLDGREVVEWSFPRTSSVL
jgi:2-polyprenyl-6-methoxyphenol hydroxylase-like FAD-dependent oxidoreductase